MLKNGRKWKAGRSKREILEKRFVVVTDVYIYRATITPRCKRFPSSSPVTPCSDVKEWYYPHLTMGNWRTRCLSDFPKGAQEAGESWELSPLPLNISLDQWFSTRVSQTTSVQTRINVQNQTSVYRDGKMGSCCSGRVTPVLRKSKSQDSSVQRLISLPHHFEWQFCL